MEKIRPAESRDADSLAAVYAPFVTDTHISFELVPPTPAEMWERVQKSALWLVHEGEDGAVDGYAYASAFHPRAAYAWSAEVSIYLAPDARGRGVGRSLMARLLDDLRESGHVNAFAGVALPNPASVRLFESFGFDKIAHQRNVGYKLGSWHDVAWWQLELQSPPIPPPEIRPS